VGTSQKMATVAEVFTLAWQHHQAGGFAQAEQLYRHILNANPRHADAWCFLGAACQAQGKLADAETGYRRAVEVFPAHPSALNCLGVLLAEQGRLAEATATFEQALQVSPESADILNNLGLALARQKRFAEAINTYQQAISFRPDYAHAHYNLGLALNSQGQRDTAIEEYRCALRLVPNYPEALNDLGNALGEQGKLDEAILSYQQALRFRPHFADAHYNLAVVLGKQNKHHAALFHYQEAIRHKPHYAEAHMNLGNVLHGLWRFDEAVASYQEALRHRPTFSEALHGLAGVYLRQGRVDEAAEAFKEALRLQPDSAALQSNLLFCMNYDPGADLDEVFEAHRRFGEAHEQQDKPDSDSSFIADPSSINRRLRIGYVSPDLRYHALARYFEPVLKHHDAGQVEVFCYAEVATPDPVTVRLQTLVQELQERATAAHLLSTSDMHWRSTCGMTDAEVAQQIRDDGIDIVVDLAGHTANNRLCALALKPAPIQATWLGYMNSTGLRSMDYRLTDEVLDPPGQTVLDTEELVRLDGGMCCFAPPPDAPVVSPLPALSRGYLTFGSLHNLFKLNTTVFDLWSRLLKALPTARLLMFRHTLVGSARDHIHREFTQRGIGPEQLDFRQGTDAEGYLRIYDEIDVGLDSFPYTGGVTTCESLWMGVPVLSLCGSRPASRNSAGILARVGLSDWAVETEEQYLTMGASLANDLERLARLRAELRERMANTVCDAEGFTRTLENTYRNMWRRWCESSR
jgi:predicted O-linked N-acetylglucosamine transferase (SPINDLY family)